MSRFLRRGVLMTASSRRSRQAWLEEEDGQEDTVRGGQAGGGDGQRKASNEEWREIEREVREAKRRIFADAEFKSGRRGTVVAYDDVAEDGEEVDRPQAGRGDPDAGEGEDGAPDSPPQGDAADAPAAPQPGSGEAAGTSEAAPASASGAPAVAEEGAGEALLPPEGAVTAGQAQRERKRGGQKKTGAQKRREAEEKAEGKEGGGDGSQQKRKKSDEDEDPDRWIKLSLEGEKKAKRIDATRIVVYHDFDGSRARSRQEAPEPPEASRQADDSTAAASMSRAEPSRSGDFRSRVRRDLWDDDE